MGERDIFLAALDRENPVERTTYLDEACGADVVLRQRVVALLQSHEGAGSFLGTPAAEQAATNDEQADAPTIFVERGESTPGAHASGSPNAYASGSPPTELEFLAPSQQPRLGRLAHYEIMQVIGQGGMGVVLKAFDTSLHRVVAIKVMAPQLATTASARARFVREARAAAAVCHEHVVMIHAVDEKGPLPFIVMQCVEGSSLEDKLNRVGPFGLKEILRIGMQTAEGLAAAHKQGQIHRDIKPANILLENGVERVKITDFGLARAVDDASMTQSGLIAGTPQYMSPEQAEGKPVDQRSDLFSLGSVLYALATGRPAFRASSTVAVLKRVCEETPRPIREINPEIPEWLCDIIAKLHAKDPAERFQTAKEVSELLSQHLAHVQHPTVAPKPAPVELAAKATPPTKPTAEVAVKTTRGRGRRRVIWLAAIAAFVIFLVLWYGPSLVLTSNNQGQITFSSPDTQAELILRREGKSFAVRSLLNPTVQLLPGTYQIELQPRLGREVEGVSYSHTTLFLPFISSRHESNYTVGPEIHIARGDRVKFTARFRDMQLDGEKVLSQFSGSLYQDKPEVGKVYYFEVVGENTGHVWGTDEYTSDSALRTAAVHAGALQIGERGVVKVTMLPGQNSYTGSTRNGIISGNWPAFPGSFRVERAEKHPSVAFELGEPDSAAWEPLFNSQDLNGWKTHPTQLGGWRVEKGVLVGESSAAAHLFSERADLEDFYLRAEVQIDNTSNSGIYFRTPYALKFLGNTYPPAHEIQIYNNDGKTSYDEYKTGSLHAVSKYSQVLVKNNDWFTIDLAVRGNRARVRVNGVTTADTVLADPARKEPRGRIVLQAHKGSVRFRNVEIQEMSRDSGGSFPKTAEEVLPSLAGTWKGEYFQKVYGGKPAEKKISAVAVNDWIVAQKWLRQRVQLAEEGFQSITTFEPGPKLFRDWFFHSRGLNFGPSTGRWDAGTRTLTWTNLPDASVILLMSLRFVDEDTISGEILIRDKEGLTVFEMSSQMQRTTENVVLDDMASAEPLPAEMAVLDRLVGDWESSGVIKNADHPEGLMANWQNSARRILGGRVIATQRTGYPGDDESYSFSTFDTFSNAYGRWSFRANGSVMEYGGLWDEEAQTLKWHWAGKDGSQSSNIWNLRDPNRRDWQLITKDALGKTTFEVQATSVRQSPESNFLPLFNGKNFDGWVAQTRVEGQDPQAPWRIADGVLWAKGGNGGRGSLRTAKEYEDYSLKLKFRLPRRAPGDQQYFGDTGVVIHRQEAESVFPPTGFGLHLGRAWQGRALNVGLSPPKSAEQTLAEPVELKPEGEWNDLLVTSKSGTVEAWVNGKLTAKLTACEFVRGFIALDANGTPLDFRDISIQELPTTP